MSERALGSPPSAAARRKLRLAVTRLAMTLICLFMLVPLYWMVITALKPLGEALQSPPTLWPHHLRWKNFTDVLHAAPFARYISNSLITSLAVAVGNVATGSIAGYALARQKFPGRGGLLAIVLGTVMIPVEATFIPNYVTIQHLHWYNSYTALIVPWLTGAFSIFLYRQTFMALPEALFDAARLDGCSEFRRFRSVALPLARSVSLTVLLISFVWNWNSLLWPLLTTSSPNLRVVQLGLTSFQTEGGVYVNLLMAATTLSVIPIAVLFVLTQRFIIKGIGEGALR